MSSRLIHPPVPVFEALLVPHRSLGPRGAGAAAVALAAISLTIGLRFLLLGAWPVMVFSLLEVPLLGVLLAVNLRRARVRELILLDHLTVTVTQTDPGGRRKTFSLPAAWLQVSLEAGGGGSRLMLISRGQVREIGAFMHQPDRAMLFEALRRAMHEVRTPGFDNPQLSDD
jgi:uncharacterized membrane protein